eukprot:894517-Lingulodinium_polyedra.AAC.1
MSAMVATSGMHGVWGRYGRCHGPVSGHVQHMGLGDPEDAGPPKIASQGPKDPFWGFGKLLATPAKIANQGAEARLLACVCVWPPETSSRQRA